MAGFQEMFFQRSKGLVPAGQIGGARIALGNILAFEGSQWAHVNTVKKKFGLTVEALPSQPSTNNSYSGSGGKGFSFKAYGAGSPGKLITNVAEAKARAEVIFGSSDAFMFTVLNQRMQTLGNLEKLFAAIRLAYHLEDELPEEKQWRRNYAVVIGIASADSVVISLAQSRNAEAVISASGRIGPPAAVAEVSARMKFAYTSESLFNSTEAPSEGYAYQLARINPKWYRIWKREVIVGEPFALKEMRAVTRTIAQIPGLPISDGGLLGRLWSVPPPDGKLPADGFEVATPRGGGSGNLPVAIRSAGLTPAKKPTARKSAPKRTAKRAAAKQA